MGDRKRRTGTDGNIQVSLRDIDADKDEGTHSRLLSCLALRNAGSVALATVRALQVRRPDDPRWNSVWYRPRNHRFIRPQFFTVGSIVPQAERYKEPLKV